MSAIQTAQSGQSSWQFFLDGIQECSDGLASWRIWHLIGTADLRRRYLRSKVGQLWVTASTGILIFVLGFVWTVLWKTPISEILPHIAVSMIIWLFMNALVTEATTAFVINAHYCLNQGIAFSTFIYALVYRNVLVLAYNAIIIVLVMLIFNRAIGFEILMLIPAFMLTLVAGFCLALHTAILCTRYRDLTQLITSVMQVAFYVTPVLWKRDFVPEEYDWIIMYNPLAIFLSLLRDPLFGEIVPLQTWLFAITITLVLFVTAMFFVGKKRRRIIYWI